MASELSTCFRTAPAVSTSVTLTLSATDATSGVAQMSFSNDESSGSAWESCATSKAWTLSAGDGSKTVHVRYQDNAGNISAPATDTIALDTTPPTGTVSIFGATGLQARASTVTLKLSATDDVSGVGQMLISN